MLMNVIIPLPVAIFFYLTGCMCFAVCWNSSISHMVRDRRAEGRVVNYPLVERLKLAGTLLSPLFPLWVSAFILSEIVRRAAGFLSERPR